MTWLRLVNKDENINPLDVLGRLIENYMEAPLDPNNTWDIESLKDRERITNVLAHSELQYVKGGKLVGALGAPSKTLEDFIKDRDFVSIDMEFKRALSNVGVNP